MCWTRSKVSPSSSMYSSSTPSVYGSAFRTCGRARCRCGASPLPVIEVGGSASRHVRFRLDLDTPARVEQGLDDDCGRGRADSQGHLAVRATDLLEVVRLNQVDAGPALHPQSGSSLSAAAPPTISKQRRACS